jgi:hypothetical protein
MYLRPTLARAALLSGLLLPAGCGALPFDDSCGPETRGTYVHGQIRDAGGTLVGVANVSLNEVRGGAQPRTIFPVVVGPAFGSAGAPLKGRVTSARLVGPGDRTLYEIPTAPGVGDQVLHTVPEPVADEAAFSALRRSFRAGEVVLLLRTDLPGREQLRTPLPLQYAGDWDRAHCS